MTTARQKTIGQPAEMAGTGLHTGASIRMRLLPGAADTGIVFRRVDLPGSPEVRATVDHVVGTDRGTTVGEGETHVHTVEHLLAAVSSLGIDNLLVEMDGPEPPAADGSAR